MVWRLHFVRDGSVTGKVFTKLFLSFVLVLAICTAILDFSLRRVVERSLEDQAVQSLAGKARLLANEADRSKPLQLQQLATRGESEVGAQVGFFSLDGSILASSHPIPQADEPGVVPPEVQQALSGARKEGQNVR